MRNPKIPIREAYPLFLNFGFRASFGFRQSDFGFPSARLFHAKRVKSTRFGPHVNRKNRGFLRENAVGTDYAHNPSKQLIILEVS